MAYQMRLRHLDWQEAADLVVKGVSLAIAAKTATSDLARAVRGGRELSSAQLGEAIIAKMGKVDDVQLCGDRDPDPMERPWGMGQSRKQPT